MPNFNKSSGFSLKSGNKPAFKMMAGQSPLKEDKANATQETTKVEPVVVDETKTAETEQDKLARLAVEKKAKKKAGWKKAGKVAAAALTGGLDAVYGSGSIVPVSVGTSFANSDVETAEEKTDRLLKRKKKNKA